MTELQDALTLLGQADEGDETAQALDALAQLGLALVRQHVRLERRVRHLEGVVNRDGATG